MAHDTEPRRRRWWPAATIALAAAGAIALYSRAPSSSSARAPRRPLALLALRSLPADRGEPAATLSQMLRAELGAGEHFRALSSESTARLERKLAPGSPPVAAALLARLRD